MRTFNLTTNELKATIALVKNCLAGMCGERPADLMDDPYTWAEPQDLIDAGWTKHEAAGTWGALEEKGIVGGDTKRTYFMGQPEPLESYVDESVLPWLETIWDANQE